MFPLTKILLITILNIFLVSSAYAQVATSTTGNFTFLEKGESAPFKGMLFDPVATAKILAEKEMAQKKCEAQSKHQSDLAAAGCKRRVDLLTSELEIEKRKNNLITSAQQEEIEVLRKLAKGSNTTLWVAIGFGVGALTSIGIFYAAVEVSN